MPSRSASAPGLSDDGARNQDAASREVESGEEFRAWVEVAVGLVAGGHERAGIAEDHLYWPNPSARRSS
jgi:hypothetical protein